VAVPITVPRLDWSMDEGTFVEWLRRDGEPIKPGEPLFVLESAKAAENIEALDAGILRLGPAGPKPGDKVAVGQVLAYLVAEGESLPEAPVVQARAAAAPASVAVVAEKAAAAPRRRQAISPRARRLAGHMLLDWKTVQGSGRNGRIRERDVRAAAAMRSGGVVAHTNLRRTIAAHMVAGVTQAAPVTLTTRANAGNLVALRRRFKASGADGVLPGYSDMILKLTAAALARHPLLQAQWQDDGLFMPAGIHIALAVDTDAGLLVPVLRHVDRLTLPQVAAETQELITLARAGRLTADQMRGATFTITNLGMFGVDAFTPIIHLPQSAVLGVGRIVREPVVVDDQVVPGDTITLSLTFDHRVVDGAPAARFLDTLRRSLEEAELHVLGNVGVASAG
jgi:pyruvate dehydrogenase E2 component (dihydrolipoamide acetyltransferase)